MVLKSKYHMFRCLPLLENIICKPRNSGIEKLILSDTELYQENTQVFRAMTATCVKARHSENGTVCCREGEWVICTLALTNYCDDSPLNPPIKGCPVLCPQKFSLYTGKKSILLLKRDLFPLRFTYSRSFPSDSVFAGRWKNNSF